MAKKPAKDQEAKVAPDAPEMIDPQLDSDPANLPDATAAADAPAIEMVDPQLVSDGATLPESDISAEVAAESPRNDTPEVVDPQLVSDAAALPGATPTYAAEAAAAGQRDANSAAEAAAETADLPDSDARPAPGPSAAPVVAPPRESVFLPMLLGGLFAGGIGYGIAYLQYADQDDAVGRALAAQSERISAVEETLATLPEAIDLTPLETAVSDVGGQVTALDERLSGELATLGDRVETIAKQPSADGTLQEAAIAAYERDIAALREDIAAQQLALEDMTAAARAQLDATREEALSVEADAVQTARDALARAALARVQGALESGAPLGAALADLDAALAEPVPDAISAAEEGAATLASLRADYPDAARAALSAARAEGQSGEEGSGFSSFLRSQLNVRSTAPREGNSTDAILSRAESSLDEGRLADTLAELSALPDVARAAMSDWIARAETRAAAIDAADQLATSLNVN